MKRASAATRRRKLVAIRLRGARAETVGAEGVRLYARPAIDVHGQLTLRVGKPMMENDEAVVRISGYATVGAIKQLMAGTEFRLWRAR